MSKKSVESHIKAGDYFGTLATILDLLRQDAEREGWKRRHGTVLGRLRGDLVRLQRGYEIKKK